jgi:hypothetical protein
MTDKAKIEKRSNDSQKGMRKRKLLNSLREGEDEMRRLSCVNYMDGNGVIGNVNSFENKPYLPREKNEAEESYNFRVAYRTSLFTGTAKSINDINDRIFSKPVKFSMEDDEDFEKHILTNFNGSGAGINEFAKSSNKEALWSGCAFILANQNSGVTNKENMPNAVLIRPNDIYDLSYDKKGNIEVFKHSYTYEERIDEFESQSVTFFDIYYYKNGKPFLSKYKKIEEGEYSQEFSDFLSISQIPIVEIYPETDKKGLLCNKPYQNMAWKNLTHWIYNSIYMTLVDISSRSFIFGSGFKPDKNNVDEDGNFTVKYGIHTMHINKDPSADMKWVQADSKSTDMIKEFLRSLEDEMKMLGSEFLETKAIMTATEVKYSTSDTNNRAQNFAFNLEKALKKTVEIMLEWHNKEGTEFDLEVNKNIGLTKDEEVFTIANALNDKNIISDKELRNISKKVGYLNSEKTEEEFLEELEAEGKAFSGTNLLNINKEEEIIDEEDEENN